MAEYSTRDRSKLFKSGLVDTADIKDGALTLDKLAPDFITEYAPKSYVDTSVSTAVSNLVDSAPGVLDTLNELAAAIGDDANFVTTINDAIDLKFDITDFDSTFDTRLATKDTDDLAEGANLYYTDTRARDALSASDGITYDSGTGAFSLTDTGVTAASYGSASLVPVITINANGQITSASTVAVAGVTNFDFTSATNTYTISTADGGSFSASGDLVAFDTGDLVEGTNLYYTDARWDTKMAAADTGDLTEGTNLYFTTARARASISVTDAGGDGSLSYNSTSGVITYTGPSAAEVRAHFSGGTGVDITDGVVSIGQPVATTDNVTFADITADSVQLTGDSLATGEGLLSWNSTDHTLDIGLANGSVLQVGQEQHFYAKADGAIPNGAVVMFSGAQGGHVLVTLADLSSVSFEDRYLVGVATNSIANGEFGYITSFGKVRSLDTSAWTEGTILYADPATPGGLTATAPTSPLHAVAIAAVVRSHAVVGEIMVRTETGAHLSELHDVHFTSTPTSGQFIRYNSTNSRWENESVDTGDIPENGNLYYTTARANTDFDTRLATKSTTNLAEGTNLYYTNTRARAAISVTDSGGDGSLSYNSATGVITYTGPSATEVRAHLSAGTGVTYSSGQFSIGQAVATTSNVTFNSVTTAGDVTVGGNLTVNGTTTTVNATNLAISDNMIYLNEGSSVTNPDLGWSGNYNDGTYAHTGVFRDASDSGKFKFFKGYTPEPSSEIDTTHASFALADVVAANFYGNLTGTVTGNASTATTLQTARTINGVSFNGSASITVEPYIEDDEGTAATRYIVFTDNSTGGYKRLNEDSSLNYNPSTNTLVAGTFSGALSGNAATASKWLTARTNTVTLTGDVTGTGNASVDGSGNWTVSLATTVAANSVALGTDTTGNYMVNVAAGGGITVSHTQGEGSTATVSHSDTSSIANLSSDNANGVVIQDIALTYDTYGHAQTASVTTVDLDGRYYTETEADARFVNVTGDTMTGDLTIQGKLILDNSTTSTDPLWHMYPWEGGLNIYPTYETSFVYFGRDGLTTGLTTSGYIGAATGSTNPSYPLHVSGTGYASSDFRAPIFYDSNDTGYYLDPNTSGISLKVRGSILMEQGNSLASGITLNQVRSSSWPLLFTSYDVGNDNSSGFWVAGTTGYPDMRLRKDDGTVRALTSSWERSFTTYGFTDSTDIRAPIFYDSNDTSYYVNPNSLSVFNQINMWGRLAVDNPLDYASSAVTSLNSAPLSSYALYDPSVGTTSQFLPMTHQTATYSSGYRTHLNTGLYKYASGWGDNNTGWYAALGGNDGYPTMHWKLTYGTELYNSNGYVSQSGSFRAPIFYDTNDTGYYVDPRSASVLSGLKLNGVDNNASGTDAILWVNKPNNNDWAMMVTGGYDYGVDLQMAASHSYALRALANGSQYARLGTDLFYHNSNIRAPIFYDSDNTSYYWNPNTNAGHRFQTPSGYLDLGPMNTSFCHFQTDRDQFYFNKNIVADGAVRIYSDQNNRFYAGGLVLRGTSPTIYLRDTDHNSSMIHCNSNIFYVLRGNGVDTESWATTGSGWWPMEINLTNNNMSCGGNFTAAYNVTAYSDARLKENVVTVDNALEKVLKLRGVYYTRIDDEAKTRRLGVIAQEIQEVLPEVVSMNVVEGGPEGCEERHIETLSVDYGNITGALIEAIKEQQTIINTQEERIAKLESLVEKLLGEK